MFKKKKILYSQKIWWELNILDCPKPVQTKILVDFNLVEDQAQPRHPYMPCLVLAHTLQLDAIRV